MDITTTAKQSEKQTVGWFTRLRTHIRSSIRLRFWLTFTALVLLLLTSAAVSWASYTTANSNGDRAIREQTAVAQLSINAQYNLLTARTNEHNYQTNGATLTAEEARTEYLTPFVTSVSQIRQRGIELKLLLERGGGTAEEIALVDTLMAAVDQYETSFLALVNTVEASPTADVTTQQAAMDTAVQTISDALNTLGNNTAVRAANTWERTQLLSQLAATSIILILLVTTAVTIFLGVRLTLGIAQPIYRLRTLTDQFLNEQPFEPAAVPRQPDELHHLTQHVNTILGRDAERATAAQQQQQQFQDSLTSLQHGLNMAVQGNFSVVMPADNELTRNIARTFNQLLKQLNKSHTEIETTAGQLDKATQALHITIGGLAEKSGAQIAQIKQFTAVLQTHAEQTKETAQTLHGSTTTSQQIQRTTSTSHKTVQQAQASMERIRQQVQETAKLIKRLGESSQEISEISDLMGTMADQLSLLALNTSIKTKGSATGSAQLKQKIDQMAEQATNSAATIRTLIETIQRETAQVITAMETTTAEVVNGSKLTAEVTQQLNKLNPVSGSLATSLKGQFSENQQQAQEADQLASQMVQIARLIEKNHDRTQKLAAAANGMKQLSRSLTEATAQLQQTSHTGKLK